MVRASLVALLALSFPANVAEAAPKLRSKASRAKRLARQAKKAYLAGDLERATRLLQRARTLDPAPTVIYNLARVLDSVGDLTAARAAYADYLVADPDAPDKNLIERRIDALDRLLASREAPPPAGTDPPDVAPPVVGPTAPAAVTTPPLPSPRPRSLAPTAATPHLVAPAAPSGVGAGPWVVVGAGAVALAAGSVLGFVVVSKESDARAEPVQVRAAQIAGQAEDFALGRNLALGAGVALIAAGVTWAVLRLD